MGLLNLECRYGKTSVTHCLIQSDYTLSWPCEARRTVVLLANEARESRESARLAAGCVPHLRVSAKVAYYDEPVHHFLPTLIILYV